ncbi:MAG: flippase-like domain-containing protein [Deltaproteobacteria bacterium]|nr:flippase-like domain-containing protein [Deltaproteobacteria bacterium]
MKTILKNVLALLLLSGLIYMVNVKELWAALAQLTLESIFGLALLSVALIYVSALKWKLFLEYLGSQVSTLRLFLLYLVGYFVNLLMPSYLGGDIVRSWYVGKKVGQHEALAATILERYTGIVAMVALAFTCMWFVSLATVQIKFAVVVVALGLITITVLALSPRPMQMLERYKRLEPVLKNIRKVQDGFQMVRGNKALLCKALLLSLLYHSLTVINTVIAAQAVGWEHPPIGDLFVVLPIILLVGSIPATPNGLGIQEGAFYFFLHGLGATPAQALGVAVVLRAKSYVLALTGGLAWLSVRKDAPAKKF